jgi:hypothetical protein
MVGRYVPRVALALVVSLLSLELGLQLLALVGPSLFSRASGRERGDAALVIAVGDSHTYGAVDREDAFPAQLEARLRERHPDRWTSVVNLGLPGLNSVTVANRLEGQVRRMRPDLIVVWVGINDIWNLNDFAIASDETLTRRVHQQLLKLKLYRLTTVVWSKEVTSSDQPVERMSGARWRLGDELVEVRLRTGERPSQDLVRGSREHSYERMIRIARDARVPILFVTYPRAHREEVEMANQDISRTAARWGVPVVDGVEALRDARASGHAYPDLFVRAAGPHPNGLLYQYFVDRMVPIVERLLEGRN